MPAGGRAGNAGLERGRFGAKVRGRTMRRSRSKLPLLLALLAAGSLAGFLASRFVETGQGPVLKSELSQRHLDGAGHGPPVADIDFAMLDEVRLLDLIEMDVDFPEALRALEGRRVRLVGFMAPWDSLHDMGRCLILPTYVGCNFCAPPSLTQVVFVEQAEAPGAGREFIEEPSEVSGTLRLLRPESTNEGHANGFFFALEDAVATPYFGPDAPERPAGHEMPEPGEDAAEHATRLSEASLPLVPLSRIVHEVAALRGLEPLYPIRFTSLSDEAFAEEARAGLLRRYPEETLAYRSSAFALLGFFGELGPGDAADADWIETLLPMELGRRIAFADPEGVEIRYLERARAERPFVRLELVREIAAALARQHFAAPGDGGSPPARSDADRRRAYAALEAGHREIVAYRYAVEQGITFASSPPEGLLPAPAASPVPSVALEMWHWLPAETGPFFVDSRTGSTGPLALADALFHRPPETTAEIFRPRWYNDPGQWRREPVEPGFADGLLDEPPRFTDTLGLGGLIPWLATLYPVEAAKALAGDWAGDRYALWEMPGGGRALLLETRWQSESAAQRFLDALPPHPVQHGGLSAEPWGARVFRAEREEDLARLVRAAEG